MWGDTRLYRTALGKQEKRKPEIAGAISGFIWGLGFVPRQGRATLI